MRQKILIIRFSSIGDIIHCSAIPRHLKKKFPQSMIHWLVRSDNRELVEHSPYVTKTISFDRRLGLKGLIALARELKKENYTHVYDAHSKLRSWVVSFILRPPHLVRYSKSRVKRFFLFLFKINLFSKKYRAIDSYLKPLEKWQITNDGLGSEIFLAPGMLTKVRIQIPETPKGWIAIAPATAWPKKTWPLKNYKELIEKLLRTTDYNFLILGGPKDDFCQSLCLHPTRTLSLQGKLSLLESAAAVTLCHTLIAADTGVLHMAESLKKNVIAILGPTPFGHPYRMGSQSIQKKLWCQPCSKDGSGPCINPRYQKCMKMIEPHEVIDNLRQVMERS